jgi:hypothetical protein
MNCDKVTTQLSLMLYGDLSFDEEELVQAHLQECAGCRGELQRVRTLHDAMDAAEPPMPADLLQNSRRELRLSIAALQESGGAPNRSRFPGLRRFFPAVAVWKPAAALTLLVAGFAGGRWYPTEAAATSRALRESEPMASRVRYVQPEDSGRVQIVVEEVRQHVLKGGLDDDRIRTLLVSAAREANDPGVRVETMDLLKSRSESSEVRTALLAALQHDRNPGVRLKAIEALRDSADDDETRRVLTRVLLNDDNPGIRTQAIDLLTKRREPELVGVFQELIAREPNTYVRMKCQRALNEMNASVETF